MLKKQVGVLSVISCVLFAWSVLALAGGYHVIPYKGDPPIVVDGVLDDWANVPNTIVLRDKAHVTFQPQHWTGPGDLSATVYLAWRNGGLYVAAQVTDDTHVQPQTGHRMFDGDHITLFLDFAPNSDPGYIRFNRVGQAQIGLSPGSLGCELEDEPALPPEVHLWHPTDASVEGSRIVAKKTDTGYVLEAFVPFKCLKVPPPSINQDFAFEVAVSDCDVRPEQQQCMIMLGTTKWELSRKNLNAALFGDGNGKATPIPKERLLRKTAMVPYRKAWQLRFTLPKTPMARVPHLFFQARIPTPRPQGWHNRGLRVAVNGTFLDAKRLTNRKQTSIIASGNEHTFITPDGRMTVPYTPSVRAFETFKGGHRIVDGTKGCDFEFDLGALVKPGENTITFKNDCGAVGARTFDIVLENIRLYSKYSFKAEMKPAPTGPLPVYEAARTFPKTWNGLKESNGRITLLVNGEAFIVSSVFTAPDGKTYTNRSPFYTHTRKVIPHDEWIEVRDTFKNITDENVPIMQIHSTSLGKRAKELYLSCVKMPTRAGRKLKPENPTVFATTEKHGLGLVALNDVFRVHSAQGCSPDGVITLSDRMLVLKPGVEYTAEWGIVPVTKPDLWAFVNAVRRLMGVNFTNRYSSVFAPSPHLKLSDDQFKKFIENKSSTFENKSTAFLTYTDSFVYHITADGERRRPHGEAFLGLLSGHNKFYQDARKRVERLFPDGSVAQANYYHSFLDVIDANAERFKDCRMVDVNGKHVTYGEHRPWLKLYVPTLENEWGKLAEKCIDQRLKTIGISGIYWDEFNYSNQRFTYNAWDGWSADIDPKTGVIKRLKASVHLRSLPFLVYHAKRIMSQGSLLVNGAPNSRTIQNLHIQNFLETATTTRCHETLLNSPVALGDHLTERTPQDCYRHMLRVLNWGCLYNWYSTTIFPEYKTLTEHMFPFTPIELHSGYVIGKERIITNRSGLFGWGDNSDFTVYVYDRDGRITQGKEAKKIIRAGKTYAEIRIPEGYSAAVVRTVLK